MSADPTAIVDAYFARMRARDPAVVDLFHDDARLVGLGSTKQGRPAILEFYRGVIEGASPTPRLVGSLLTAGSRVAAEIQIELANGATIHALDLFELDGDRIRSLTYFLASH